MLTTNLHELAFKKSLQANIISAIKSPHIMVCNQAASRLFGYSEKELLTVEETDIFDTREASFRVMLKQRSAGRGSTALVTAITKKGRRIPCNVTSAVFTDADGIKKFITTVADMRPAMFRQKNIDNKKEKLVARNIVLAKVKQQRIDIKKDKIVAHDTALALNESDAREIQNTKWVRHIAQDPYDLIWDWNIKSGEINMGDSIEDIFGYNIIDNSTNFVEFMGYVVPEDRDKVQLQLSKTLVSGKKTWSNSFKFKRSDNSIAITRSRGSIIRDKDGKAIRMIGATQDLSRVHALENKLRDQIMVQEELGKILMLAGKFSSDGIWDWNLLTNEYFMGNGFEELSGDDLKNSTGTNWANYLHPDDKESVQKSLHVAIESSASTWEQAYRLMNPAGSVTNVFNRANILRQTDGKAYRIIGAMHDITKQNAIEEQVKQEINLKEMQIEEARNDARKSVRSDIGKELHDNVNQLLAASSLYLNMAKQGGENSKMFMSRSSQYTTTAIEEIRKLTRVLTSDSIQEPGLCESIENTIHDTMEVHPLRLSFARKGFNENKMDDKSKHDVFRIVQEQINNILKHARATEAAIILLQNKRSVILSISDNGVGFDTSKKHSGIGIANIKSRALSNNGSADFISEPGLGCNLKVTIPFREKS